MIFLTDILIYAGIAVSVLGLVPLYIDMIGRYRSRNKIVVELEKFFEANNDIVESLYGVRIFHPTKAIEHCKVYLNDNQLPWWDSTHARPNYDRKIPASGGGNVRVPEVIRRDDAIVVVKNGKKTLKKMKFSDIPRAG